MYYKHLSSVLPAPCGNTPIQTVASSGAMCRKRINHGCFRLEKEKRNVYIRHAKPLMLTLINML